MYGVTSGALKTGGTGGTTTGVFVAGGVGGTGVGQEQKNRMIILTIAIPIDALLCFIVSP